MKLFFLLFIIFVFLSGKLQAIYIDDYYFPDDKISLIEENFYNDLIDGSLERFNNFDAFLIASGIFSNDERLLYWNKLQEIEKSLINIISTDNQDITKGKIILQWLHENIFKQYKKDTNGLSDMMNKGLYDCLTSSIMYYILSMRFGLEVRFVKVPEHVFCQVYNFHRSQWIIVETTSQYGYNPGEVEITKMDSIIVQKWLKKTKYNEKEIISFYSLLSYVILERNLLEFDKEDFKTSNYTKKHLYIFKKAIFFNPQSALLRQNIKALLIKYGNQNLETGKYDNALVYIKEGLINYDNEFVFQQLHVNYYLKKAKEIYLKGDYERAIQILEDGVQEYPQFDNIKKNLSAYIAAWGNEFFKAQDYKKAIEIYKCGLNKPINHKTLTNNIQSSYYNLAYQKFCISELEEAIDIIIEARSIYPFDYNLKELHNTMLYNITILYYNREDLIKAKHYCVTGMKEFPENNLWYKLEEKINRAYKIFYFNLARDEYYKQNYKSAIDYCVKGLEIETKSKDLDKDLKDLKKKSEFWL